MPDQPERQRLSPAAENPETGRPDAATLNEHQQALRRAMMDAFSAKKARRFIERHVNHININRDLAEGIKFLFDEKGRPPENMPLEDIIDERRKLEYQLKWFEGIVLELNNRLVKVREMEDYALEMLSRAAPED
ncbi:hypothetical protein [Rubrivivax albus]|uniref:Uncharacterized protein n=1 Tax=Rubrivivax albus TaxID=2499835 RepID=A0A3S3SFJ5_9BURK|nr:hypothetical protein [Rubrivivax albus]RVT54360.1 hypothetical protein ENE75_05815 [Rubrivivax albus]